MSPTRLSPDGLYYWDGGSWVTTLSADGSHRWNGAEWAPQAPGPTAGPVSLRTATSWTRPLQYAVAGWYGVQALWLSALPFWYISTMTRYADEMNRRYQQLKPSAPGPPPGLGSSANTEATVAFYVGIVLGLALAVVAIAGAVRRWTWAFYAILVLLGLEAVWLVLGGLGMLALSLVASAVIGQYAGPPAWLEGIQFGFGIASAAIFVLMLMAKFQKGPWARRDTTVRSY